MGTLQRWKSQPRRFPAAVRMGFVVAWLWDARVAISCSGRQVVSFDFGWKHRAGLHGWPDDPYEPPINTTATGRGYVDPGDGPAEASVIYNGTSDWIDVDIPHDGIISNPFGNAPSLRACPDGCSGRSFIPRHVLWYRKQFRLPSGGDGDESSAPASSLSWQEELVEGRSRIYLRFDGSFRNTTVYLNGRRVATHECGYTPFRIELTPSILGLREAPPGNGGSTERSDAVHTVAVFVDPNNGDGGGPARGSGWWYEGGGLYRHAWLEKVPRSGRLSHEGVFVTSEPVFSGAPPPGPSAAAVVRASMRIRATFEIEDPNEIYCYAFTVRESETGWGPEHDSVGRAGMIQTSTRSLNVSSSETNDDVTIITVSERLLIENPILWTSSHPHLYEVTSALYKGCGTSDGYDTASGLTLLDETSVHHGIRSTRFDPKTGFYWNEEPYKIRGFCDHDTFAVVGMAVPDRINLFRVSEIVANPRIRERHILIVAT